jgi:NADH-quinone oxidoreductase subunit J
MNFDPSTLFAVFFYAFAGLLVISALRVVTVPNPVHAALFLVLAFFSASGIWMLLKAEFLSLILILVYVGAVMVLFLFVVMMLDLDLAHLRRDFKKYLP